MFVQYIILFLKSYALEWQSFRGTCIHMYVYKQMVLHNDNDLIISGVMNGYKGPVWFIARALSDLATHFACQQLVAKRKKSHNLLTKLHP